jgi:hypothetical protein
MNVLLMIKITAKSTVRLLPPSLGERAIVRVTLAGDTKQAACHCRARMEHVVPRIKTCDSRAFRAIDFIEIFSREAND